MRAFHSMLPAIVAAGVAAALAFAINRYVEMESLRSDLLESKEELAEAQHMVSAHPEAFDVDANSASKADLKALVQKSAARIGVPIAYLNETERDAGEKVRERDVYARAINVSHTSLIAFLADLEANGGGARIKEIHVKIAPDRSDMYLEAESILAIRWLVEPPTKTREQVKGAAQ
jgi:hypothetical protein